MQHTALAPKRPGPPGRTLAALALAVALLHLVLLLGVTQTLDWSLQPPSTVNPLNTRMVPAPAPPPVAAERPAPPPKAPARRAAPPAPSQNSEAPPPEAQTAAPPPAAAEAGADTPAAQAAAQSTASAPQAAATENPVAPPVTPAAAPTDPAPSASWPTLALGTLPPSSLLKYQLTGMDKGLTYHASGELRWQQNPQAYALSLSVKAFLVGSRQWRSHGLIDSTGLSPLKFSDSWRSERSSHFDREQKRIVFSSNSRVAALQPGAQDQISLYMQLASAMAGNPDRFPAGTRLQVQTVTLRDAVPWILLQEGQETLNVAGQSVAASKWVCQPRNQFEAKVEIWLSPRHAFMPARIRITQVSGSYIDLELRSMEALAPLPADAALGEKTTSS